MYYKYDEKKAKRIKELNNKISEFQQEIFDILLKISQSFSDENITKKERNELFGQVDILKNKIKEYNRELKEVASEESIDNEEETKENVEDITEVSDTKEANEEIAADKNDEIENAITELEDSLKELEKNNSEDMKNFRKSKRKKARTQLVVVEDDDSLTGKIKGFFKKLKSMIK